MRKLRLGQDIDGVLYRWSDTARYLLKTHWDVDVEESTYYDYIKDHVSPEAWKWLWNEGVKNHGLFRYGSLYKGAREFLDRIQDYCDIVIITSRPASAVRDTMDWLSYQRIPTSEVHVVNPGQAKSDVHPHCDVYFDDAEHNAIDILSNTNSLFIMSDKPWNQKYWGDDLTRFHRAYSWAHTEHILKAYHEQINRES